MAIFIRDNVLGALTEMTQGPKNNDDIHEEIELTPEELEQVAGGLGALERFGSGGKGVIKGDKFRIQRGGKEINVKVSSLYNGAFIPTNDSASSLYNGSVHPDGPSN